MCILVTVVEQSRHNSVVRALCHCRASEGADCWTVSKHFTKMVPATTTVLVRTNGEGTAVIDEGPQARGSSRAPRRLTRSKHALDDTLPVSPRRKRTRY